MHCAQSCQGGPILACFVFGSCMRLSPTIIMSPSVTPQSITGVNLQLGLCQSGQTPPTVASHVHEGSVGVEPYSAIGLLITRCLNFVSKETITWPGTVAHACNTNTREAEAGGLQVQGQGGLYSNICFRNNNNNDDDDDKHQLPGVTVFSTF